MKQEETRIKGDEGEFFMEQKKGTPLVMQQQGSVDTRTVGTEDTHCTD